MLNELGPDFLTYKIVLHPAWTSISKSSGCFPILIKMGNKNSFFWSISVYKIGVETETAMSSTGTGDEESRSVVTPHTKNVVWLGRGRREGKQGSDPQLLRHLYCSREGAGSVVTVMLSYVSGLAEKKKKWERKRLKTWGFRVSIPEETYS